MVDPTLAAANLSARFPEVPPRRIREALTASGGHAGKAIKWLTKAGDIQRTSEAGSEIPESDYAADVPAVDIIRAEVDP